MNREIEVKNVGYQEDPCTSDGQTEKNKQEPPNLGNADANCEAPWIEVLGKQKQKRSKYADEVATHAICKRESSMATKRI